MRSVSELLKTYNVVNTPEGRKYTVRFLGGLIALALIGTAVFWGFGGPDRAEDTHFAGNDETDPLPTDEDEDLLEELPLIVKRPTPTGVYIAFNEDALPPETEEERLVALQEALADWSRENPSTAILHIEDVRSSETGLIEGFEVHFVDAILPLTQA